MIISFRVYHHHHHHWGSAIFIRSDIHYNSVVIKMLWHFVQTSNNTIESRVKLRNMRIQSLLIKYSSKVLMKLQHQRNFHSIDFLKNLIQYQSAAYSDYLLLAASASPTSSSCWQSIETFSVLNLKKCRLLIVVRYGDPTQYYNRSPQWPQFRGFLRAEFWMSCPCLHDWNHPPQTHNASKHIKFRPTAITTL